MACLFAVRYMKAVPDSRKSAGKNHDFEFKLRHSVALLSSRWFSVRHLAIALVLVCCSWPQGWAYMYSSATAGTCDALMPTPVLFLFMEIACKFVDTVYMGL